MTIKLGFSAKNQENGLHKTTSRGKFKSFLAQKDWTLETVSRDQALARNLKGRAFIFSFWIAKDWVNRKEPA